MDFLVEVRKRNVLGGREVMVHPDLRLLNLPMEDPTHLLDHDLHHHPLETLHQTCLEATLVVTDLNLLEPQDPHQDLKPQILTLTDPPLPLLYPKILTPTPMDPPLPLLYPKILTQTPMDPLKQILLVPPTLPNLNPHLRPQEPQPPDPQTNLDLHRSFT